MNATAVTYYQNYSPVGDIMVLATCIVFVILMRVAYISKSKNYKIFQNMIALLILAAVSGIVYHMALNSTDTIPHIVIYALHAIYHLTLFLHLYFYVVYIKVTMGLDSLTHTRYTVVAGIGFLVMAVLEIGGMATGMLFRIGADGEIYSGFNIFMIGYIFFVGIVMYMLFYYRSLVYKAVLLGIVATIFVSFAVMAIQGMHDQVSFTTASFLFPAYSLLYLIHSNPYDIEIGTLNLASFEENIRENYARNRELVMFSLYMHEFDDSAKKYPKDIREVIRYFTANFFKDASLFQISGGHMILVIDVMKNPDYEKSGQKMLSVFADEYPKYNYDYKIVITKTSYEISKNNEYISLIKYIENKMPENSVYRVEEKDFEAYAKHKYILSELADINAKKDMFDRRVLVYCQPVYNIMTGKYDTAEALMRLKLDDVGMVFPDQFIPIAESTGYILTMSMIILSKTCAAIKQLLDDGYNVKRISVNFSVLDLRDRRFSDRVTKIIKQSGIPFDKIAVEITESQNEKDFNLMKEKIDELKNNGIKFYLDDFGTGYSSFERIMELPFDIIKFDRSLVLACGEDEKSETMVNHLANMFNDMNYSVLYEGIETEQDEERCVKMCAKYLQGFRYSKPIPIEELKNYFEKNATA